MKRIAILSLFLLPLACTSLSRSPGWSPDAYDVVWTQPSQDANGSMPLGNGDIAVNAWVAPSGELHFYISKSDAWGENGRLLKVGRLRVVLDPLPSVLPFKQTLRLRDGAMHVSYGEGRVRLALWVDANAPVIHVTAEGPEPLQMRAIFEPWRTETQDYPRAEVSDLLEDRSKPNHLHERVTISPDIVLQEEGQGIGLLRHNARSVGPARLARIQGLEEYFAGKPDPLLHRCFGAFVTADGGERIRDVELRTRSAAKQHLRVHVLTEHPSSPEQWRAAMQKLVAAERGRSLEASWQKHVAWWRQFWQRSWIHVTSKKRVSAVPRNSYPVRVGVSQTGGERYPGSIGRLQVLPRAMSEKEIAALAAMPSGKERHGAEELASSKDWRFERGFTIEAWVRPSTRVKHGGRLVDKITPGRSDGFLFDTHPGRGLRLIVGEATLSKEAVLRPGEWQHVAAVLDPKKESLSLFLGGKRIATKQLASLDDAFIVSRAYALQRYVSACAGRGRVPIKYNGSLFTVPAKGKFGDADYRRWGPGFWWQNTRLPYLSMFASGDFEMIRPLFRMYVDELLPLHKYRTKRQTGCEGAFLPECIYWWGPQFMSTYGWTPIDQRGEDKLQVSGWHKREWVGGLELVWMMLDYFDYTDDEAFLEKTLLPAAHEFLIFFENYYKVDGRGKLVIHPSQALETYWDATNPTCTVSALRGVLPRLLALPERFGSSKERAFWKRLLAETPELPVLEEDGVRRLAPAERFAKKQNVENPELYAVFPFRLVSFEKKNAALGIAALEKRKDRGHFGWRQDDLFMSYLGLAEKARSALVQRARRKHAASRFPVFWGPNYDWIPDQDHGGILTRTLQSLLLQCEGKDIYLLPAWPKDWDADFRLHAPHGVVIEGKVQGGRFIAGPRSPD